MRSQINALWSMQSQLLNTLTSKRIFSFQNRMFGISSFYQDKITEKNNIENKNESLDDKNDSQLSVGVNNLPDLPVEDQKIINSLKKGNVIHPYKTPGERAKTILIEDIKVGLRNLVYLATNIKLGDLEVKYFPRYTDVVIVGCNVIGLSVAFAIRNQLPYGPNIIVVDKDENAPLSRVNVGMGTLLQQQFTDTEEIEMAKYCAEFLSSFHIRTLMPVCDGFNVPYEPLGSLILGDENNAEDLLAKYDILKHYGVETTILGPEALKKKFPWLNLDNVLLGSLGTLNEGLFEPWQVLYGMKMKLINLGVQFVTAEVIDFGVQNDSIRRVICRLPDGTYNSIDFGNCVISAGMGSHKLIQIINNLEAIPLGIRIPFEEKNRYEFCLHNPNGPGLNTPIVINSDGTYFRREGLNGFYVAGLQNIDKIDDEKHVFEVFDAKVKPFLETRLNDFKDLKVQNGWVNSYDSNSANELGVIGRHPCSDEIFFAIGFTKAGFTYGPAVGRGLMERMFYDDYKTINFKAFEVENLYRKQHLAAEEKNAELLEAEQRILINE